MQRRYNPWAALIAVAVVAAAFPSMRLLPITCAADEILPRDAQSAVTLKGLSAVRVVVEVNASAKQQPGLRKNDLEQRLAAKLKKAGLQLLAENERAQGMPTLYLNLNLLAADKDNDGLCVYSIDLSLLQEVRLLRDPGIKTSSPTWRAAGALGTIDAAEVASLSDTADELAEQFLKAFRVASK